MNIFEWAVTVTKNSEWKMSRFHEFSKNATQKEFLSSQEDFYYAVRMFPRLLCLVAGNIETSEHRLKIIENIWEEHGNGSSSGFHTNSYMTYLKSLGYEGSALPKNDNPWVNDWLAKTEEVCKSASPYLSAAYLAGVEYAYALICCDVVKYIETLDLKCEQNHYKKHSELDWDHGRELLEVAVDISNSLNEEIDNLKYAFLEGQNFFIRTYNSLYMPTLQQMEKIGQEKIAFYYSREDSEAVNTAVTFQVEDMKKSNVNVLMIASGGEHIFELMKFKNVNIDAIDINPHQVELVKKKLSALKSNSDDPILYEMNVGKFEKMFAMLRSYFTDEEMYYLKIGKEEVQKKLNYVVSYLFSNESLNKVFTDQATKYTNKSFALHFSDVFMAGLTQLEESKNISNIFFKRDIRDWKKLSNQMNNVPIEWIVANPKDFSSEKKYDVIDISNIGDWMSQEEFSLVLNNLKKYLNDDGMFIVRKLLGDYNLQSVLNKHELKTFEFKDAALFYNESYWASKEKLLA